jgi:hypothetical protein
MNNNEKFDVVEPARFEQFRKKRLEWLSWLNGDDSHSIWKQVSALLWDYVLFLTLNDLRNDASQTHAEGVGFNGPVLRLLDAGFVATQATGIRRLADSRNDVISLKRLVDDMERNRCLVTRESYLACHRLPYDFAKVKGEHFKNLAATQRGNFCEGLETKGPNAWVEAERAHDRFDELSKTSGARLRTDTVSIECIISLKSKIERCRDVWTFATKFIAHAADPSSRSGLSKSQKGVTLDQLSACHKALSQVAAFIGGRLLQDTVCASVPAPQFDPLENLDKRWIASGSADKARDCWEKHFDTVKQWESEPL